MLHATPRPDAPRGGDVTGRLRAFWRHEQQAVRMAVAAATHHSYDRSSPHACTQTDLVPQMVDNVLDAPRLLDLPTAEQVIDVPKISCSLCPSRCPIPEPQTAETVGGSADRAVSHQHRLADRGADRQHSCSSWSWSRFSPRTEFYSVFFFPGTNFLSGLWSRSSTFLLLVLALDRELPLPLLLVLQKRILLRFF